MRARLILAGLALAAVLAGCGDKTSITGGGRVAGETLTVHSLLPRTGDRGAAGQDAVLGAKLALYEARGKVGRFTVNYVAHDLPESGESDAQAFVVREAIHDPGIIAAIGDLSTRSARVSVPLLNAAGILHVSPGATYTGFVAPVGEADPDAPGRYAPSGRRTFAALLPTDAAQAAAIARAARGRVAVEAAAGPEDQALAAAIRARVGRPVATRRAGTVVLVTRDSQEAVGLADAVLGENPRARVLLGQELWTTEAPRLLAGRRVRFLTAAGPPEPAFARAFRAAFSGREPGPAAQLGYDAMRAVLDAVRHAGERAQSRQAVVEAYFAAQPLRRAAEKPFFLAARVRGRAVYEPVS